MKTVYCKLKDFDKIKNQVIENFVNPQFKKCKTSKGVEYRLHIIYPEDKLKFHRLTDDEVIYYCGAHRAGQEIIEITCNWFPKELVVGVKDKYYSESTELSQQTGFVQSANTGSNNETFLKSKITKVIEILLLHGFELDSNPVI